MAGGKEGEGGMGSRPHLLAAGLGLIHMAPQGERKAEKNGLWGRTLILNKLIFLSKLHINNGNSKLLRSSCCVDQYAY